MHLEKSVSSQTWPYRMNNNVLSKLSQKEFEYLVIADLKIRSTF